MYRVQRHANQEGFLGSTVDFQVKEKGILPSPWQPGICRMAVGWEWLIPHRLGAWIFPRPPSTELGGLFPSGDTPRDTFKFEIIVAKYISNPGLNYLLSQVSLCRHKGYTVSYSCHSTQNNTAGKNTSDKDRLLLPLNIRLGLFFSGMLKTFQRQHINFLTNMMWNKNNKTTQRTPQL